MPPLEIYDNVSTGTHILYLQNKNKMQNGVLNDHPSFYAIIPASVRYDSELSEFQKLLYGEITALADKEGYCRAGNNYFARLYGKEKKWISKCIMGLQKRWYIYCTIEKQIGNCRKIYISEKMPLVQKNDTCYRKSHKAVQQKDDTPAQEKHDHNTTSTNRINNSSITPSAQSKKHFLNKNGSYEKTGQHYLNVRNAYTGRNEVMNSEIKKELAGLSNVNIHNFTLKVCMYKIVVDIIKTKSIQKYLYYPVHSYDFTLFAKRLNWFEETYDPCAIIMKLANKNEQKKVERILQTSVYTSNHTTPKETIDKGAIKATLQKTYASLKKI